jgi:HEAT repeat protein
MEGIRPGLEVIATGSPLTVPVGQNLVGRVLDGLGELQASTVTDALADHSSGIRENALRLAEARFSPKVLAAAVRLVEDPDAKVRLQLGFSLGAFKETEAGDALSRLLKADANDPMIVAAVMSSATHHLRALVAAMSGTARGALSDAQRRRAAGDRAGEWPLRDGRPLSCSAAEVRAEVL